MLRLVCAWVVVNGLIMAPQWLSEVVAGTPPAPWLSLEAAVIVGGMALLTRDRRSRALAWGAGLVVVVFAAVSFADLVFRVSLGRTLNLSVDLYLLDAVYRLAVGNSGLFRTVLGIGVVLGAAAASLVAVAWLLTPLPGTDERPKPRTPERRLAAGMIGGAFVLGFAGYLFEPVRERLVTPALSLGTHQVGLFMTSRAERRAFAAELERSPGVFADVPDLFTGLAGKNVVVTYVESYGMAALADEELAAVIEPRLLSTGGRIEAAGLHMVSGRLQSPTLGGQSWYAHGTMLSGLWLNNQLRYELMLASDRETLVDDFRRAGYGTATVMPAITTAWPEAVRLGYDDVYTSENIGYAGPPFYWVTMPDQFTWSFLGGVLRDANRPLFVEVGMVSSHAPWEPVIPLVDWDTMGDGAVFEPYRQDGYPPEEMWWDVDVLRSSYAASLEYSLEAMTGFAERLLDQRTLLIVSGDHQAAPWITGVSEPDVPVHVIAGDPNLLDPFLEWGFRPGALPEPSGTPRRMDEFRAWFVGAFSGAAQ